MLALDNVRQILRHGSNFGSIIPEEQTLVFANFVDESAGHDVMNREPMPTDHCRSSFNTTWKEPDGVTVDSE